MTFIRYNGTHLCKKHFIDYVEKRVRKELKNQGKTQNNSKLGIAVSGGKDSTVALHIMYDIFSPRSTIRLYAITVDEGIKGYRDQSIKSVKENCKKLGIENHIITFKETIGTTLDDIAKKKDILGECTYCGVFRRFCLNLKTKELGIDKLITGHNLDDNAQSIIMNFVNADIQKLIRLGPHKKIQPGLIPRIMPLRFIPEKEVMLYAILKNISFHNAECPYTLRASRQLYRDMINTLEYKNPGTRHSILRSYDTIKDILVDQNPSAEIRRCTSCGEPTSQQFCKTCILKKRII